MNPRIKVIEKRGLDIIFVDQSELKPQEILAMVPELSKFQIETKINFLIIDVSKTFFDSKVKKAGKDAIREVESKIEKKIHTALIGIKGIQKIIVNAISKDIYFANDVDDAVEHLLKKNV